MNKKLLIFILKLLLAAVLLYVFFSRSNIGEVFSSLRAIPAGVILSVLIADVASFFISAAKWKLLLPEEPYGRLLTTGLAGRFYSFIFPGQIVGESMKAYHLGRRSGGIERAGASVVIDKLTGVTGVFLAATAGFFFTRQHLPPVFLILFLSASVVLILGVFSLKLPWLLIPARFFRLEGWVARFSAYASNTGVIFCQLILGVLYQLLGAFILFLLGRSLGLGLDPADYCWIAGAVSLALLLPLTVGGLGIREGAFIGVLGWLGVEKEKALALSLAFFAVQVFDAAWGGIFFLKEICAKEKTDDR